MESLERQVLRFTLRLTAPVALMWLFFWVASKVQHTDWYAPPLLLTIFVAGLLSLIWVFGE